MYRTSATAVRWSSEVVSQFGVITGAAEGSVDRTRTSPWLVRLGAGKAECAHIELRIWTKHIRARPNESPYFEWPSGQWAGARQVVLKQAPKEAHAPKTMIQPPDRYQAVRNGESEMLAHASADAGAVMKDFDAQPRQQSCRPDAG